MRVLVAHVNPLGFLALKLIERYNRVARKFHIREFRPVIRVRLLLLDTTVYVRAGTSDYDVLKQIFIEHQYKPLDHLPGVRTIIDCGANVGYSSIYFLERFPDARIVAVEPDPDNVVLCRLNLAPYGDRALVLASALWSHSETLGIQRGVYGDGREWATQVRPLALSRDNSLGEIEGTDVPALLSLCDDGQADIMKIDIERAESVVFQGPAEWLKNIGNIAIELHDDECRHVFFSAMSCYRFDLTLSGELTICQNIKPMMVNVS